MIYVVAAEFAAPELSAARVADWLGEQFTRWVEPVPNLWIVEGAIGAEQILNGLNPLLRRGDRIVIIKAATEAVWRGIAAEHASWMVDQFPGSITGRIPDAADERSER